jgi:hypothetical protein
MINNSKIHKHISNPLESKFKIPLESIAGTRDENGTSCRNSFDQELLELSA